MLTLQSLEKLDALNLQCYDLIQNAYNIFDQMQEILAQERKMIKQQDETQKLIDNQ